MVAGAHVLRATPEPAVTICVMGALAPEARHAAKRLAEQGLGAELICITSADLPFRIRSRSGHDRAENWILDAIFPDHEARPMVTVLDGHPQTVAFLAGLHSVRAAHLGVTDFGQSAHLQKATPTTTSTRPASSRDLV